MTKDSTYDKDAANFTVPFIECPRHTKDAWAGKPFKLINWQRQIIRGLFDILRPNDYRQFSTAYVEIPEEQDKSESATAVALLLCCADSEEWAEVYSYTADHQQTATVFDVVAGMVWMNPALKKRCKILAS